MLVTQRYHHEVGEDIIKFDHLFIRDCGIRMNAVNHLDTIVPVCECRSLEMCIMSMSMMDETNNNIFIGSQLTYLHMCIVSDQSTERQNKLCVIPFLVHAGVSVLVITNTNGD